jgi:cobalamin biosynthetic protein CobC
MLEHGGRLLEAIQHYGIPARDWLDLSTGINPHPYTPPELPLMAWHRLPEDNDGLEAAAAAYYGTDMLLPTCGSQAAIQALPRIFAAQHGACEVACLAPIYNEHPAAWRAAGHTVRLCAALDEAIEAARIVVLCNPNNPDGRLLDRATLLTAAAHLAARGGWLLVDEAFIDAHAECSITDAAGHIENLIVLRSLGKFFGLAGARVGFLCGAPALLDSVRTELGPWPIAHPARIVAGTALHDRAWQQQTRTALHSASHRLAAQLGQLGANDGTALFRYLPCTDASIATALHEFLARRGILTRLFTQPAALRFGLPATADDWHRLDSALKEWIAA